MSLHPQFGMRLMVGVPHRGGVGGIKEIPGIHRRDVAIAEKLIVILSVPRWQNAPSRSASNTSGKLDLLRAPTLTNALLAEMLVARRQNRRPPQISNNPRRVPPLHHRQSAHVAIQHFAQRCRQWFIGIGDAQVRGACFEHRPLVAIRSCGQAGGGKMGGPAPLHRGSPPGDDLFDGRRRTYPWKIGGSPSPAIETHWPRDQPTARRTQPPQLVQ